MKGDPRESPCLERRVTSQRMLQHTLAKDRADSADIDASGLSDDRCLDLAPNSGLSLPVRLRSNRRNRVGLVGEGLPRLLLRRGETVRQATEIVAIVQVFWSGVSCDSIPGLELLSLRGRYQPEIMSGVLELVLRGDRVAGCVSVARQVKVSFRYMQRRAANSDVGAI
jgi:hypothetical protein